MRTRLVFGVILNNLLAPAVPVFVILMMILTSGAYAAHITLFYYLFDIALWLLITSNLSIVHAVVKLRWIGRKKAAQQLEA